MHSKFPIGCYQSLGVVLLVAIFFGRRMQLCLDLTPNRGGGMVLEINSLLFKLAKQTTKCQNMPGLSINYTCSWVAVAVV
jgi:hypothetical protein